jgi:DHA2 family multidrug resistance protein
VGALAIFMVTTFVHEPEDVRHTNQAMAAEQRKHMDYWGIVLLTMGVASLQFVLEEGEKNDWFDSKLIIGLTAVAIVTLAAFVIRELTARVPAVNIALFKDKVFTSGTLIGSVMFAMLFSQTFLLPVFMQELLGFTAVQSGIALMPRSLTMMVAMPIVGRIYNKVSPRATVAFGVILFTISAYIMSHYTLETSARDVMGVLVIQGVAFACLFIPLTTVALASIPRHRLADATGLNSLLRQIGGSLGLAIFAQLIPRYTAEARSSLGAHITLARPEVAERIAAMQGGLASRVGHDAAERASAGMLTGIVARQSSVLMFEKLFMLTGILFLVVLPLLWFLRSPDHEEASAKPGEKREKPEMHLEV